MASLPLWYFTSEPLLAVIILTTVDLMGFGPTIRKAYSHPGEENLVFFSIFLMRNVIAIAALEQYSFTTVLFPAAIAGACLLLVVMITYRRRILSRPG